ncbi:MAG: DUF4097 family beta strand repeat-containing protein [Ktedonobacterales bacterium]
MDEHNTPQESGEQHAQPAPDEPSAGWNDAPTERHLDQERAPEVERPIGQPYSEPYPPRQYEVQYGRGVDPSLPLNQVGGQERNTWQSGREGERRRVSGWVPVIGGCLVAVAAVMVLCAVASGIVWGLARNVATASDAQTRNFTVDGPATITLRTSAANVRVVPGKTDHVTIVLNKEVRGIDHNRAVHALDAITLDATQAGNSLTINVNEPSSFGLDSFSRSIDLTITTPAATSLDATLDAGNLDVRGLAGTLATDLGAGNLTLADMSVTDHATLQTRAGNLRASHITGAVRATVNFGNVTLTQATLTQDSTIRSDAGNITLDGSLQSGASLDATDNAGNVSVTLPQQTDAHLNATANAGKITVTGWPNITQTSSGSNVSAMGDLSAHPTGTVTLHVDAGNITVTGE